MITDQIIQPVKKERIVQCEICHGDVKQKPTINRLGTKFGVICRDCTEQFSDQEIELMTNMFLAFGGYFNQFQSSKDVQFHLLREIAGDYKQKQQLGIKLESDIKTLHKAFLHGIPLAQLLYSVKVLLD
jgi:hypothetical protein